MDVNNLKIRGLLVLCDWIAHVDVLGQEQGNDGEHTMRLVN